jgi:hypothetical protein
MSSRTGVDTGPVQPAPNTARPGLAYLHGPATPDNLPRRLGAGTGRVEPLLPLLHAAVPEAPLRPLAEILPSLPVGKLPGNDVAVIPAALAAPSRVAYDPSKPTTLREFFAGAGVSAVFVVDDEKKLLEGQTGVGPVIPLLAQKIGAPIEYMGHHFQKGESESFVTAANRDAQILAEALIRNLRESKPGQNILLCVDGELDFGTIATHHNIWEKAETSPRLLARIKLAIEAAVDVSTAEEVLSRIVVIFVSSMGERSSSEQFVQRCFPQAWEYWNREGATLDDCRLVHMKGFSTLLEAGLPGSTLSILPHCRLRDLAFVDIHS